MLTPDGPRLIEYNVRFGDPECQALLPLLRSDLLPALLAACDGELARFDLRWRTEAAVAVVMAAAATPARPRAGTLIDGLRGRRRRAGRADLPGRHPRRRRPPAGRWRPGAHPGAAPGPTIDAARAAAYAAVDLVRWPEGFCRRDIGAPTPTPAPAGANGLA